jgi:hypothetical protein
MHLSLFAVYTYDGKPHPTELFRCVREQLADWVLRSGHLGRQGCRKSHARIDSK